MIRNVLHREKEPPRSRIEYKVSESTKCCPTRESNPNSKPSALFNKPLLHPTVVSRQAMEKIFNMETMGFTLQVYLFLCTDS